MKTLLWVVIALVVVGGLWWMLSSGTNGTNPAPAANVAAAQITVANNPALGAYLVGPSGMAVYGKKGELNASTCYGPCAANWPPLTPTAGLFAGAGVGGKIATLTRTDGTMQVTYNGVPLYYYAGDKVPGDTTGNGFGKIWSVVKP